MQIGLYYKLCRFVVEIRTINVQNVMELSALRRDCQVKQQRGLHFILASVFIWAGILFSVNQILYLLIAMWVFDALPEKMLMVYAMIFGAHLMPYSWLYQSRSYMLLSILIPILALLVGLTQTPAVLAGMMLGIEVVFSLALVWENKKDRK